MPQRVGEFRSGRPLSAARLNRLVQAANRAGQVAAAPPLLLSLGEAGVHFGLADLPHFDVVELDDALEPGTIDAAAARLARDFALAPSASDKFTTSGESLSYVMDHLESVWLAGSRAVALWLPGAGQRVLLPGTQWHLGKLDGPLSAGSSATVSLWGTSGGAHVDSGIDVTAYDWLLGAGESLAAATTVVVLQHAQSRRWYVVRSLGGASSAVARFKLTAALPFGGSAAAVTRIWTGAAYADDDAITVNDFSGATFVGQVGDEGMAAPLADRPDVYEILSIELPAKHLRFTLEGDLAQTDAVKSATVRHSWDGRPLTLGSSVLVYNQPDDDDGDYLFAAPRGATGTATLDPAANKWWINWVECGPPGGPTSYAARQQQFATSPSPGGALR
jgi:hypothetical protein